jgi:hypothetical protein
MPGSARTPSPHDTDSGRRFPVVHPAQYERESGWFPVVPGKTTGLYQGALERCKAATENPLFSARTRRKLGGFPHRRSTSPPMPDPDLRRAHQQYARIRSVAYAVARQQVMTRGAVASPFRFADIDRTALDVWQAAWDRQQPFGYGSWDWRAIIRPIWRRPAGFPLAIWSGSHLCGMMAGRPSKRRPSGRRHTLSLYYLEGNPHRAHPLRGHVAALALTAAEAYARALGISHVRLVEPLPGVIRIYERLEYRIVREGGSRVYLEKRM